MVGIGHYQQGLYRWVLLPVYTGNELLVFKISSGADATDDTLCTNLMAEVDGHACIRHDLDFWAVGEHVLYSFHTLFGAEHTVLFRIDSNGHNHMFKQRHHSPQYGFMPCGEGVE